MQFFSSPVIRRRSVSPLSLLTCPIISQTISVAGIAVPKELVGTLFSWTVPEADGCKVKILVGCAAEIGEGWTDFSVVSVALFVLVRLTIVAHKPNLLKKQFTLLALYCVNRVDNYFFFLHLYLHFLTEKPHYAYIWGFSVTEWLYMGAV